MPRHGGQPCSPVVSDGDLSLAVGGEVPGRLVVHWGGRAKGLRWPLEAQGGQAGPAGATCGAPLPAPREGWAGWHLGTLGLGAALRQGWGLGGQEGQGAGGWRLRPPESPVEVLRGALCGDSSAASSHRDIPHCQCRGA